MVLIMLSLKSSLVALSLLAAAVLAVECEYEVRFKKGDEVQSETRDAVIPDEAVDDIVKNMEVWSNDEFKAIKEKDGKLKVTTVDIAPSLDATEGMFEDMEADIANNI
ncbi:hypothetical protein K461DRAFT_324928 [Myriangium duriaei CBS 260.36]|uniref:Uncharacterized protein n=1 Tax=Myriangium duriaei CBS 260.36 TaxID=1168546 RepID=A0A9P4ISM1_9PEZI|nr:hypothetical protein K461DRAFT_324928 [Myriangium duriaei CBS 260.36]